MFDFASYHRAATLADAINLLADNPQAKLLAGVQYVAEMIITFLVDSHQSAV